MGRKFRFDFAWPDYGLLLEVHGSVYAGKKGGHSSGVGITRDCTKASLATATGRWRYMAVTTAQVKSGEAVGWLMEFFKNHSTKGDVSDGKVRPQEGCPEGPAAPAGQEG